MRIRAATSLLLGFLSLLASAADAGVIRGTLWMRRPPPTTTDGKAPSDQALRKTQRGVTDAVIYLEKVPAKVESKLTSSGFLFFRKAARPRPLRIVQMNRKFTPHVLAIAAGGQVEFQNLDTVYHNAFSVSAAKRFDLGRNPPGRSDTLAFTRSGVINLHCDIHPDMMGYVVVTPNHAYARPDSLGRYRLPKLPPGSYTVHVFHPRRGALKRTAEVPRRGDVTLDLSF